MRTHRGDGIDTPRRVASGGTSPADTLISDFWPPGRAERNVCGSNRPVCGVCDGGPRGLTYLPNYNLWRERSLREGERAVVAGGRGTGDGWTGGLAPLHSPGTSRGRSTYADITHLLGDLHLHITAVALLPSPLAVLGAGAIVPQGLQALVEGRDCGRGHGGRGRVGLGARGAGRGSRGGLAGLRHLIVGTLGPNTGAGEARWAGQCPRGSRGDRADRRGMRTPRSASLPLGHNKTMPQLQGTGGPLPPSPVGLISSWPSHLAHPAAAAGFLEAAATVFEWFGSGLFRWHTPR